LGYFQEEEKSSLQMEACARYPQNQTISKLSIRNMDVSSDMEEAIKRIQVPTSSLHLFACPFALTSFSPFFKYSQRRESDHVRRIFSSDCERFGSKQEKGD
jgi:hypothetical protein